MLPAWLKWCYLAFVLVLVPAYLWEHGLGNFLWFSNVALLLGLVGVWTENRLLVSTQAVSVALFELGWLADFVVGLLRGGEALAGLADYMFDPYLPLIVRLLSLYHVVLPLLLLWLVWRLGYDRRAWRVWTPIGLLIALATFFLTPAPDNINWVHGWGDEPQDAMPAWTWLLIAMAVYAAMWWLTHFAIIQGLRRLRGPEAAATAPRLYKEQEGD